MHFFYVHKYSAFSAVWFKPLQVQCLAFQTNSMMLMADTNTFTVPSNVLTLTANSYKKIF